MFRTATTAALALALSTPLALADQDSAETKSTMSIGQVQSSSRAPTPEELREIGAKRIQAQKDAIKSYNVSEDARPDDRDLVNKLASPRTAEVLLRKSVNNSQVDTVKEDMDIGLSDDAKTKSED